MKNSFVILLKGRLRAKLSKTIQNLYLLLEEKKVNLLNKKILIFQQSEKNQTNKSDNDNKKDSDSSDANVKVEYFEKTFSPGDYFDYNSMNKNGISLIEFESENDSDIVYFNNKRYNECFLSSIIKTEKQRKIFILNTIESTRSLPKLRFDMFYEHVNVEVLF